MRISSLGRRGRCIALALIAVVACAGEGGRGGTLVISAAGEPDVLFPPMARQAAAKEVFDQLFERLADIGPDLNTLSDAAWTPALATRWEWGSDSMSVTFHLAPGARWHDSVPVRASDMKFTYGVYTTPGLGGSDGAAIAAITDSLTVRDSLTFTVWYKTRAAERFFAIAYNMYPLPEHILGRIPRDSIATSAFVRRPVGNGPFRFVVWEPTVRVEIAAVRDFHRGAPTLDRVIWSIVPDAQTAVQRVFNGEADFVGTSMTSAQAATVASVAGVRATRLPVSAYFLLQFNARDGATERPHPLLGERGARRALTMATDRRGIIRNLLDSLGVLSLGPFTRMQWSADTTLAQIGFDTTGAKRILDSLGWKAGSDGIRMRGGKRFSLTMLVPSSSLARQQLAVLLQEQWRRVGVELRLDQLDNAGMNARFGSRAFDVVPRGLTTSPSPSTLKQNWHSQGASMSNSLNMGRYGNVAIDPLIDSAVTATNVATGRAHYKAAYQALLDDAAAIWLYEPILLAAVSDRVTLGALRADAWWASLPTWRVAPGGAASRSDTTKKR
jgi:peptide/nickel transport system substrate-binding protein